MAINEYYPIAKGDSLSSIAAKYGLTLQDIIGTNPWITDPDRITAGDYLYLSPPVDQHDVVKAGNRDRLFENTAIPTTRSADSLVGGPQTAMPTKYTVPTVEPAQLKFENPGIPRGVVDSPVVTPPPLVAAVAPVPEVAPEATSAAGLDYGYHAITKGDNLSKIAEKYGISVKDITDTNPWITNPNEISAGDYLAIPKSGDTFVLPETVVTAPKYKEPPATPAAPTMDLLAMYEKYAPPLTDYSADLKAAAAETKAQQTAFNESIKALMNQQVEGPSKAELYFRLAAAFSEPTKTGHFMESVGKAGTVLAEHGKEQRVLKQAQRSEALKLGLEKQKLDLMNAKDRETNLRTLASEDANSRREMAKEIIKDYVASGRPQSAAGKQALDEGFVAGTPEYQKRVAEIGDLLVQRQMAAINASLAGITVAQGNLALGKSKEARAERAEGKLTTQELDLKIATEDTINSGQSALSNLKEAMALNPKTFDTSLGDTAQRKALELAGSKDQRLLNTRNMENLLQQQALSQLKSMVGGNPTEGERAIIMELQGVGAKSVEERKLIIERAIKAVENRLKKAQTRLDNINAGRYRQTTGE